MQTQDLLIGRERERGREREIKREREREKRKESISNLNVTFEAFISKVDTPSL